jgi:hypothetical protein
VSTTAWAANADVLCAAEGLSLAAQSISDGALVESGARLNVTLPHERGVLVATASSAGPALCRVGDIDVSWKRCSHIWRMCRPSDGPSFIEYRSVGGNSVAIDSRADVCMELRQRHLCVKSKLLREVELQGEMHMLGATWDVRLRRGSEHVICTTAAVQVPLRDTRLDARLVHRRGSHLLKLVLGFTHRNRNIQTELCIDPRDGSTLEADMRPCDGQQIRLSLGSRACFGFTAGSFAH